MKSYLSSLSLLLYNLFFINNIILVDNNITYQNHDNQNKKFTFQLFHYQDQTNEQNELSSSSLKNNNHNHNHQKLHQQQQQPDYSPIETLPYWPNQVILITLYSSIAFASALLNSLAIAILWRSESICPELYLYLINLSISDIVMSLLCIPFTYTSFILNRWIFSPVFCPVVNFAQICSVMVSIWTLVVIGIDRYYAIVIAPQLLSITTSAITNLDIQYYNNTNSNTNNSNNRSGYCCINGSRIKRLQRHQRPLRRHKLYHILFIWLLGIVSGSVQLLYTRVVSVHYLNNRNYNYNNNKTKENELETSGFDSTSAPSSNEPYSFSSSPIPMQSMITISIVRLFDCREIIPSPYDRLYTIYLFVASFGLPLVILVYVYTIIGIQVWHHMGPNSFPAQSAHVHRSRSTAHSINLTREKV